MAILFIIFFRSFYMNLTSIRSVFTMAHMRVSGRIRRDLHNHDHEIDLLLLNDGNSAEHGTFRASLSRGACEDGVVLARGARAWFALPHRCQRALMALSF